MGGGSRIETVAICCCLKNIVFKKNKCFFAGKRQDKFQGKKIFFCRVGEGRNLERIESVATVFSLRGCCGVYKL